MRAVHYYFLVVVCGHLFLTATEGRLDRQTRSSDDPKYDDESKLIENCSCSNAIGLSYMYCIKTALFICVGVFNIIAVRYTISMI